MKGITLERAREMVGPGWGELLEQLYDKLPQSVYVCQVKEKFGGLRFYIGSGSRRTHDLIARIERESESICELCGKTGEIIVVQGWYMCRCPKCAEEKKGDR